LVDERENEGRAQFSALRELAKCKGGGSSTAMIETFGEPNQRKLGIPNPERPGILYSGH